MSFGAQTRLLRLLLPLESGMYSVIPPLLPTYRRSYHLSVGASGIVVAAYSVGLALGAWLGGWVAERLGVRATAVAALGGFALVTLGLAESQSLTTLELSRAAQGVCGGALWSALLAWLVARAAPSARGEELGTALGYGLVGMVVGPAIGGLAVHLGSSLVFVLVAVLVAVCAPIVLMIPGPVRTAGSIRSAIRLATVDRSLRGPTMMILVSLAIIGAVGTLVPLRLAAEGASGPFISLVFMLTSAVAAACSPVVGRRSDRAPRREAVMGGSLSAVGLLTLCSAHELWVVAAITVILVGAAATWLLMPAMLMLTHEAERAGLMVVAAVALGNLLAAVGESAGALGAGAVADISSDAVPLSLLAALAALCARFARRPATTLRRGSKAPPAADHR